MKPICYCLILVLLLLGSSACQEDTIQPDTFGSIFGEVLEAESNIGIADVKVSSTPPTSSVVTDAQGRFSFENIKAGTYSLRMEKDGYTSKLESVTVFADQTANVVILLSPDTMENTLPMPPMNLEPVNGATNQEVEVLLRWTAEDADADDRLSYDLKLYNADQSESMTLLTASTDTSYLLTDLEYNTVYFWQVTVYDGRGEAVNSPVWGFETQAFPDHRYLFVRQEAGQYNIYSSDRTGEPIRLTFNAGSSWRPRMSPLRDKIAYISNSSLEPQIFIMNRDGSENRQVTSIPISGYNNLELDFCWSPDGTQLVYMSNTKLYTIQPDGSGLHLLNEAPVGATFTECDWTAQGNFLLVRTTGQFAYQSYIYQMDAEGNYIALVQNDAPGGTGGPMYSIDGGTMLFTQDAAGFEAPDGRQLDARIYLRNLTSQITTDLSIEKPAGTNDLDARYSPDGAQIIFVNTNNDGISPRSIWVMDLDGENRTLLFENAEMPEWR
ncbi:MAG: carboxypeptidase regulatory-like domain-containing protein [Bacteroidota bacterium]